MTVGKGFTRSLHIARQQEMFFLSLFTQSIAVGKGFTLSYSMTVGKDWRRRRNNWMNNQSTSTLIKPKCRAANGRNLVCIYCPSTYNRQKYIYSSVIICMSFTFFDVLAIGSLPKGEKRSKSEYPEKILSLHENCYCVIETCENWLLFMRVKPLPPKIGNSPIG